MLYWVICMQLLILSPLATARKHYHWHCTSKPKTRPGEQNYVQKVVMIPQNVSDSFCLFTNHSFLRQSKKF